jgi:hypothetical protein
MHGKKNGGYVGKAGGRRVSTERSGASVGAEPAHQHSLPARAYCLVLDGVFNKKTGVFHPAPALQDEDVKKIVDLTAKRVIALLERRGVLDEDAHDDFACDQPLLAGMTSASIMGLVSVGDRAGRRVRRVLSDPSEAVQTGNLCFASSGFSLHAATRIADGDKAGLERLCPPSRYALWRGFRRSKLKISP